MSQTRRLAAILAADVEGYSRLIGADEVREEQRIRFRIGVNLGDVIVEEQDIFGDGVNLAARLEGLAEPGGICISGTVRDHVGDRLPYAFEDLGEQSVKNIARPVRAYSLRPKAITKLQSAGLPLAVPRRRRVAPASIAAATIGVLVVAAGGWWFWPATRPASTPPVAAATSIAQPLAAPRLSIVVLPFANLSNDPDQQYFADGITDDLTTNLSRISDSFVILRNTAFTYRNKPVDTKQIGRELGVRYVLEGSVRRAGEKVRVNAQLINAEADAHLWADQFDGDIGDLFALQNEITSRIAIALSLGLLTAEVARPTENPDTLDYILRGRASYWKPLTRANLLEAIGMFERALALDPRSVEVQSRLADVLSARVIAGWADPAAADIARAEALAGQALAASPGSALAHAAKGQVLRAQRRFAEAIPEYEAVLALNRNSPGALFCLGQCKLYPGSIEEAIRLVEQAIRLSPHDPQLGLWYSQNGFAYLLQSRIDEAIPILERGRNLMPDHPGPHLYLASAYGLKGETEQAAAELAEARRLAGEGRLSNLAKMKEGGYVGVVPSVRALLDATFYAGCARPGCRRSDRGPFHWC